MQEYGEGSAPRKIIIYLQYYSSYQIKCIISLFLKFERCCSKPEKSHSLKKYLTIFSASVVEP